ncbi:MAG: outer membrane beta-barrel protein, partial [Candidatus Kapabacteria bacterium]|nr:outer membrane beta-barrel protein [Candidatus Kapabacteria bacterium]
MRLFRTALCALFIAGSVLYAQNPKSAAVSVGGGFMYGVNEAKENRDVTGHIRMAFLYAFSKGAAVEVGASYAKFASQRLKQYTDYNTTSFPLIDARLRLSPFQAAGIKPYIYAGWGYAPYSYEPGSATVGGWIQDTIHNAPDTVSGGSMFIPLGIGVYIKLGSRWGLDLSAGGHHTLNDDMNLLHDDENDGF